jgi:hypothetical protein
MSKRSLTPSDRAGLGNADRGAVEVALASLPIASGSWLAGANRYAVDGHNTALADAKGRSKLHKDLSQYVAALGPLHCADGWSYLGRALEAGTRGNQESAIHLAYYASLRAALSVLATEGIAVLNYRTVVLDATGKCNRVTGAGGTHLMTWLALKYWAGLPRAATLVGRVIGAFRVDLSRWLAPAGGATVVASDLLREWGADLQRVADDQVLRNAASYNPTRLEKPGLLLAPAAADFLQDWWRTFEPTGNSPFQALDPYLVRTALERVLGRRPLTEKDLAPILSSVGEAPGGPAEAFLLRRAGSLDPTLMSSAGIGPSPLAADGHLPLICRASLLLRLATGSVAALLRDAGISVGDLEFWWVDLLRQRGILSGSGAPPSPVDLWLNVDAALADLDAWRNSAGVSAEISSLLEGPSGPLWTLGGTERVQAWGLLT